MQPALSPPNPAPRPTAVTPVPAPPRRGRWWLLAVAAAAGTGVWWWTQQSASRSSEAAAAQVVPTATVRIGNVQRTIRLTGTTAATSSFTLISPQLRGSRGGRGRGGGGGNSGAGGSGGAAVSSNGASGGGSGSGVSSTSSSFGGSGGGGSAISSALRSATSRLSRPATGGSSRGPSGSSPAGGGAGTPGGANIGGGTGGSTGGGGDLGSTAGGLVSYNGLDGGGGDFQLVIQNVAAAGKPVKKGQIVAEFDRELMLTRLEDFRSSVAQAEQDLKRLQVELDVARQARDQQLGTAKAALDKAQLDLRTLPVLGEIDSERLKLVHREAQERYQSLQREKEDFLISQNSQLRQAEIDLNQSKLELQRAERNLEQMILRAPIDGIPVMKSVWRGPGNIAQIQSGDQVYPGQAVMDVVDTSSLIVTAMVNQVDVQQLRIGQQSQVRFDAFPGLTVPARLTGIGAMASGSGWRDRFVKTVPVRFQLEHIEPRIIPDLSVSIDVVIDGKDGVPVVPRAALAAAGQSGSPVVFVRTAAGQWERRTIELGLLSHTEAAVVRGLREGEVVALGAPAAAGSNPPVEQS